MKDIIWPARRKFIKRAPIVFAGATALAMMPKVAAASLLKKPGANKVITPFSPSQPAIAATWSYNTLSLWDDFLSPSTIDLGNTCNPGYNWYLSSAWKSGAQWGSAASALSLNGSILTMNPASNSQSFIANIGYTSASNYVGTPIAATGWYMECNCALSTLTYPTNTSTLGSSHWMNDLKLQIDQNSASNTGLPLMEVDTFEYGVLGPTTFDSSVNQWNTYNAIANHSTTQNYLTGPNYLNFNRYGQLWVPMAKNSGTGLIQFYFNGAHQAAADVTYTSGNTYSYMESSPLGFQMFLDTCGGVPFYVDSVQVWQ